MGSRPPFAPSGTWTPDAVSPHPRVPLAQDTESENLPSSSVLSGWFCPIGDPAPNHEQKKKERITRKKGICVHFSIGPNGCGNSPCLSHFIAHFIVALRSHENCLLRAFSLSDDLRQLPCEVTERIQCAPQTSRGAADEVTCFVQVARSLPVCTL